MYLQYDFCLTKLSALSEPVTAYGALQNVSMSFTKLGLRNACIN